MTHCTNSATVFFFTFMLVLGLSAPAQAQPTQSIRGVVSDRASGAPIPFASVVLADAPSIGITTDTAGCFTLKDVTVGRHTVQVSSMGYEPSTIAEILVTSAKEIVLEIPLREMVQELGEIVVRPKTNKTQPLNKMALVGGRMLSVEEARRYAGGMDDPARLASSFAGVASNISNNGISIHGNAPHLLQWRVEDVEVPNPNHFADISTLGGGVLSSLSSNVLGNSDFFTGAFPAEYNNAISGVFDMKLRNGNNQRMENTVQAGILGIDLASEGPLSKRNKASYIINYRYSTLALLNLATDLKYQDLNFKLNLPTLKAGTFTVWGTGLIDDAKNFNDKPEDWETSSDRQKSVAKQYSGATGIGHRYVFKNGAFLKTSLAATFAKDEADEHFMDMDLNLSPKLSLDSRSTDLVFNTSYNRKFGARHTNKTGVIYTEMFYDMKLDLAPFEGSPLETISMGNGHTGLVSAYTSSSIALISKLTANLGINCQLLTLNNHWTVEPRMAVKWQTSSQTSLGLAYGLHSRMEKINVFFVKDEHTGQPLNKDLDFTRTHHLMLSFNYKLSDNMNLRLEPYFQYLFNVPVIADSSYSVLNRSEFYVQNALVNEGSGRNVGLDLTLEKYLTCGLYYMVTASLFDSKYRGGDKVWRNTRFNRNYIVNLLVGKEWMLGRTKQNMLSANVKLTYQGGDRYSPIDRTASLIHPEEVVYNESEAFSQQYPSAFMANFSLGYSINRRKVSHTFGVNAINVTGTKSFYGHAFNLKTGEIDRLSNSTAIPNVFYRINF